jgi:hypothetical protein
MPTSSIISDGARPRLASCVGGAADGRQRRAHDLGRQLVIVRPGSARSARPAWSWRCRLPRKARRSAGVSVRQVDTVEDTLPRGGFCPAGGSGPARDRKVTLLPEPGFADDAQAFAARTSRLTSCDRLERPARVVKVVRGSGCHVRAPAILWRHCFMQGGPTANADRRRRAAPGWRH